MHSRAEILKHVVTGAHSESDNRHRGGLVCEGRENTRVADVEVRNIMSLRPLVGDGCFWVIPNAANSGFMQAVPGRRVRRRPTSLRLPL